MAADSRKDFVFQYLRGHAGKIVTNQMVEDHTRACWGGPEIFRDPSREMRKLAEEGLIEKVARGEYRWESGRTYSPIASRGHAHKTWKDCADALRDEYERGAISETERSQLLVRLSWVKKEIESQ